MDLRKLTMAVLRKRLQGAGVSDKEIFDLSRWDRVKKLRELAAAEGDAQAAHLADLARPVKKPRPPMWTKEEKQMISQHMAAAGERGESAEAAFAHVQRLLPHRTLSAIKKQHSDSLPEAVARKAAKREAEKRAAGEAEGVAPAKPAPQARSPKPALASAPGSEFGNESPGEEGWPGCESCD